uniref:Reverse transcriptase zinc-binding domain-containing protein n=1 Tax=Hordeum vulgare subsp. vulgare TaxID=112509 RepID=A0A8I6ZEC7_HORVV
MANLHHKTIISHSDCPRCALSHEDELQIYILCPYAVRVWALLGLQPPHSIDRLWKTTTPVGLDINIWPTVALAIFWKLQERPGLSKRATHTELSPPPPPPPR